MTIGPLAVFFSLVACIFALDVVSVSAENDEGCRTTQCRKDLAAARAGTAAYHDLAAAVADDFVEPFNPNPCFTLPEAGMGFHFIKPSRVNSVAVAAEPELLVYMPDEEGIMHLVAVEYLVPGSPDDTPPVLFGQEFHYTPLVSG